MGSRLAVVGIFFIVATLPDVATAQLVPVEFTRTLTRTDLVVLDVGLGLLGGITVLGLAPVWGRRAVDTVRESPVVSAAAGLLGTLATAVVLGFLVLVSQSYVSILLVGVPVTLLLLFARGNLDRLFPVRVGLLFFGLVLALWLGLHWSALALVVVVAFRTVGVVAFGTVLIGLFGAESRWLGLFVGLAASAGVLYLTPRAYVVLGGLWTVFGAGGALRSAVVEEAGVGPHSR